MKSVICFFKDHDWEGVSFKPNGKEALSWSLRVVPEYDRHEKCNCCGKERVKQFISLAD